MFAFLGFCPLFDTATFIVLKAKEAIASVARRYRRPHVGAPKKRHFCLKSYKLVYRGPARNFTKGGQNASA